MGLGDIYVDKLSLFETKWNYVIILELESL